MAAPRKYPDELRERATRMAVEARRDPATRPGALARIGKQLGINPETLRNWVTRPRSTRAPVRAPPPAMRRGLPSSRARSESSAGRTPF
jgi:transposase-like protein